MFAGDNVCLLKTAVANVHANDTGIEGATILLEGSRTFLTEGLAEYRPTTLKTSA